MMKRMIILLFVLLTVFILGFKTAKNFETVNDNDTISIIKGGIRSTVPIRTQYLISKFYRDKDEVITYFTVPIEKQVSICDFQFGELAFFITSKTGPPMINYRRIMKIVGRDTMRLEFTPPFGMHIYIDSIPFRKGRFFIDLEFPDDYVLKDSVSLKEGRRYFDALFGGKGGDSLEYLYNNYVSKDGLDFIAYYYENQDSAYIYNMYSYCHLSIDTTGIRSAKEFIKDVLGEKYIPMKVVDIVRIDSIKGIYWYKNK